MLNPEEVLRIKSRRTVTLFDEQRSSLQDSVQDTITSLNEYGPRYRHWAIAFSGGKDSSVATTLVLHLIKEGKVEPPESLTVLYADTRMELLPLHFSAMAILDKIRSMGHRAEVVLPPMDDRFMIYMLGRGVPPPKNRFRWCTSQIKIEPMQAALKGLRERVGEKILMLTGVRVGESAARDQRISLSCSRDGSECGQGWFQTSTPESIADTLAPILTWRTCHVWDWLFLYAPRDGFETQTIAEVYDADIEGSANEISARTGCVGCPLASKDLSIERVIRRTEWNYLHPLKRLRPLYMQLQEHQNRLRKGGEELRVDGSKVKNPGRIGPLKIEARLHGLEQVLAIQNEINAEADRLGRPKMLLIDAEEEARIRELCAANTWPNRWSGEEVSGDTEIPEYFQDGTMQPFIWQ